MKEFKNIEEAKSLGKQEAIMVIEPFIEGIIEESYLYQPEKILSAIQFIKSALYKGKEYSDNSAKQDENIIGLFKSIRNLKDLAKNIKNAEHQKIYLESIEQIINKQLNKREKTFKSTIRKLNKLNEVAPKEKEDLIKNYVSCFPIEERSNKAEEYRIMLKLKFNSNYKENDQIINIYKRGKKRQLADTINELSIAQAKKMKGKKINIEEYLVVSEEFITTEESELFNYPELSMYNNQIDHCNLEQLFDIARNYYTNNPHKGLAELANVSYTKIADLLQDGPISLLYNKVLNFNDIREIEENELEKLKDADSTQRGLSLIHYAIDYGMDKTLIKILESKDVIDNLTRDMLIFKFALYEKNLINYVNIMQKFNISEDDIINTVKLKKKIEKVIQYREINQLYDLVNNNINNRLLYEFRRGILEIFIDFGNLMMFESIIIKMNNHISDEYKGELLEYTINRGCRIDIIKLLFNKFGENINFLDKVGIFKSAVKKENKDLVNLILDNELRYVSNEIKIDVLLSAANEPCIDMVTLLIKKCKNILDDKTIKQIFEIPYINENHDLHKSLAENVPISILKRVSFQSKEIQENFDKNVIKNRCNQKDSFTTRENEKRTSNQQTKSNSR